MREGHKVVLVEFAGRRPFSVVTRGPDGHYDHYDFAWSRANGCLLYELSGHSLYLEHGDSDYWLADGEPVPRSGNGKKSTGRRLKVMPKRWPLEELFSGHDVELVWCKRCRDWFDFDEDCGHLNRSGT